MNLNKPKEAGINLYILIATSPTGDKEALCDFTEQLGNDTMPKLEECTGVPWRFHVGEMMHLDSTDTRQTDDFLRDAFLRMVQASCDAVLVVTDVAVVSESQYMVSGLAAPEAKVAVLSTRKMLTVPMGEPVRSLDSPAVRWNATALFLHLTGHLLKLEHQKEGVMAPFSFDEDRRELSAYSAQNRDKAREGVKELSVWEVPVKGKWSALKVHQKAFASRPGDILAIVWRSKAPLLPLSLTKIMTAAVTPAFLMFFTNEFWWVGIHRDQVYIWTAAVAAILGASLYIPFAQSLLFPHRVNRVITSNIAIVNMGMGLTIFVMVLGLFLLVMLSILLLEVWFYPPELVRRLRSAGGMVQANADCCCGKLFGHADRSPGERLPRQGNHQSRVLFSQRAIDCTYSAH